MSERVLARIAAQLPELIAAVDTEFRLTGFNSAFAAEFRRRFGVEIGVGADVRDLLAHLPDDERRVAALWGRALAGETFSARVELDDAEGGRTPFELRFHPLLGPGGEVEGAYEIARDVAAEEAARRASRDAKLLSEASALFAGSRDVEGMLRDLARLATRDLADYSLSYCVDEGGTIRRVGASHEDPALEARLRELAASSPIRPTDDNSVTEVVRSGEPLFRPEVTEAHLAASATDPRHLDLLRELGPRSAIMVPLRARGRTLGVFSVATAARTAPFNHADVGLVEELASRAALAMDNLRLYDAERWARAEAEEASQAKTQFLAIMSHELRTPLNAIIGFEELLESEVSGPLNDEQRDQLERIRVSAWYLLELIDEVLTLAKLESGRSQVVREEVDMAKLARMAISLVEPAAARKGLRLDARLPGEPVRLCTDPGKVRQILLNLLSNAVKFTDEGSVAVRIEAPNGGNVVCCSIVDSGPGIPADDHARVFEPFTQLDPVNTRREGGAGLGLPICRRLARLLGGDVILESAPGRGSTFVLSLPTSQEEPAA